MQNKRRRNENQSKKHRNTHKICSNPIDVEVRDEERVKQVKKGEEEEEEDKADEE